MIITRMWHGVTKAEDAGRYLEYIQETGLADYKRTAGNLSAHVLRKIEGDRCHFITITQWDSYESIIRFAGEDYERARYYPEDQQYLLEFEEKVVHYETYS